MTGQGLQDLEGVGLLTSAADLAPVALSIDLRVQHANARRVAPGHEEEFSAIAAAGLVLDVPHG